MYKDLTGLAFGRLTAIRRIPDEKPSKWLNSFETFRDWALSSGYCDDLTIDRIDNDKEYSPDNCRWSTNYEQTRNRGNTVFIEYRGHVKTLSEWSSITKIPYQVLWYRLFRAKNPWSVEEALENFSLEAEVNGCKED